MKKEEFIDVNLKDLREIVESLVDLNIKNKLNEDEWDNDYPGVSYTSGTSGGNPPAEYYAVKAIMKDPEKFLNSQAITNACKISCPQLVGHWAEAYQRIYKSVGKINANIIEKYAKRFIKGADSLDYKRIRWNIAEAFDLLDSDLNDYGFTGFWHMYAKYYLAIIIFEAAKNVMKNGRMTESQSFKKIKNLNEANEANIQDLQYNLIASAVKMFSDFNSKQFMYQQSYHRWRQENINKLHSKELLVNENTGLNVLENGLIHNYNKWSEESTINFLKILKFNKNLNQIKFLNNFIQYFKETFLYYVLSKIEDPQQIKNFYQYLKIFNNTNFSNEQFEKMKQRQKNRNYQDNISKNDTQDMRKFALGTYQFHKFCLTDEQKKRSDTYANDLGFKNWKDAFDNYGINIDCFILGSVKGENFGGNNYLSSKKWQETAREQAKKNYFNLKKLLKEPGANVEGIKYCMKNSEDVYKKNFKVIPKYAFTTNPSKQWTLGKDFNITDLLQLFKKKFNKDFTNVQPIEQWIIIFHKKVLDYLYQINYNNFKNRIEQWKTMYKK